MIKRFHVIKDPVHGTMQFDDGENAWIKPFIGHPLFQRLRHIKQLGLGDMIFPGAVHTRFNHCLGCCYVASQIANKIGLNDEDKKLVMLAGLLHDLGHGPFSHAFEGLFEAEKICHEDWTPYFLNEFDLDPAMLEQIKSMIMHQGTPKKLLADIVSSQLDADRLDYLLRDSHFCGVTYGAYDLRWMLHSLTRIETEDGERLGITHKGIGVAEHYLNARRLMMRNIYHNPKKIALEFWLVTLLKWVSKQAEHESRFKRLTEKRLGKFLMAVNAYNQSGSQSKASFIEENYAQYKQLCDYDVYALMRHLSELDIDNDAVMLSKRVYLRHLPKVYHLHEDRVKDLRALVSELREKYGFKEWQLALLELPHQAYSGLSDPILVNRHGITETLDSMSLMVSALSNKFEHANFLVVDTTLLDHKDVVRLLKTEKLKYFEEE